MTTRKGLSGKLAPKKLAIVLMLGAGVGVGVAALLAQSAGSVADEITGNEVVLENGLVIPAFDAAQGRQLFGAKGCVVCHGINGIGGEDAPPISADYMDHPMNAFEFAAKMWRGAPAMIAMQEDELGGQIELTGDELAALTAFAHSAEEQAKFSEADIPAAIREIMSAEEDADQGEE